mmetsp:Transcript_2069/g.4482  ORF Transcript_2069/g.4482 Transcript_2069/m.4482 type:complete len:748 (-) Transcript_2069:138-2381(-)
MVKLRSRLIRSPFSGAGEASSNNSDSSSSPFANHPNNNNNNNNQQQQRSGRQGGGNLTRRRNNNQGTTTSHQQQNDDDDDQRRPFESLDATSSSSNIASPSGKRKPESRGITASIRRAKTAMFRMASSPMTSSSAILGGDGEQQVVGQAALGNAAAAVAGHDEQMDTTSSEETTSTASSTLRHRAPSQEENVPPLALLSPNCGTFYAHAAAADAAVDARSAVEASEANAADPNAMDVDVVATTNNKNVLEWMANDAPPELLPKLLSFCGSRKMNALSQVNKAWNAVMKDETVWRVLCEDTHKWSDEDNVPQSWAQHYKSNPCVPIDYDTVEAAFDSISSGQQREMMENNVLQRYREQRKNARILLHPGPYFLRRPLVANVVGDVEVTIESISGVKDPEHGMTWRRNYHKPTEGAEMEMESQQLLLPGAYYDRNTRSLSMEARRPSSSTLRQMFGCGRRSSSSPVASASSDGQQEEHGQGGGQSEHRAAFHRSCFQGPGGRSTAVMCLESHRANEPVIRVRQGTVNIRGLKFVHDCEGTDIWNGNAVIQVQRAFGQNGRPLRVDPSSYVVPTLNISDCDIVSLSGRGVVIIDGAVSHIHNCNIHNSAGTGVYVGGSGSMATMTQTDVVDNGVGNLGNTRRGVARGHSGVYVEQGLAKIHDCNISGNSLTGISAVSTVQARLHIEESDVRANRSDQMELPSMESGRTVNRNNSISSTGYGRPRSRHLRESVVLDSPRGRVEPSTPQSPL